MSRLIGGFWIVASGLGLFCCGIARAENISLNFSDIEMDYVDRDGGSINFGGTSSFEPLPAGFFGPGSDPFLGSVPLQGAPGAVDTIIRRLGGANFGDPPTPQDIPIEIVALNLVSATPIAVTFNGGLSSLSFDVYITLDPLVSGLNLGLLRVTHNEPNQPDGGMILPIDSFFDVLIDVSFRPLGAPPTTSPVGATHANDRLRSAGPVDGWGHQHAGFDLSAIAGGFIPGVDPFNLAAPPQPLHFVGSGLTMPLVAIAVVPEPTTLGLLALGLAGLGLWAARSRRNALRRAAW